MAGWDGNGNYIRDYNWIDDKNNGVPITAGRMQPDTQDIATLGFGNCLTRDGQGSAGANLPMNSFRHTGVGNAVDATDYAAVGQVQNSSFTFSVGGGTSDAITGTYAPAIVSLINGVTLEVSAPGANATTTPTFSPNGLTARVITKRGGTALSIGEYTTDQRLLLSYDLPNTRWELLTAGSMSATALLDTIGNVQGDVLYRDAATWNVLAPTTTGRIFRTNGAGANPSWATISSILDTLGSTQGQVLFRGSSNWNVLAPGTAGQVLQTNGASANPSWGNQPATVLATGNLAASTTLLTLDLSSYTSYRWFTLQLSMIGAPAQVINHPVMVFSTTGGSTFISANYAWSQAALSTSYVQTNSASDSSMPISTEAVMEFFEATVNLYEFNSANAASIDASVSARLTGTYPVPYRVTGFNTATNVNALKITATTAPQSGKYTLVGYP